MNNKTEKQTTGKLGEDIAEKFLVKHNFVILERNYWKPFGEIDIICEKEGKLHFVEVKSVSRETVSRETNDQYRPEDNIHSSKLKRIENTIEAYLNEKDTNQEWELDAVIVLLDKSEKTATIRFLQNITA